MALPPLLLLLLVPPVLPWPPLGNGSRPGCPPGWFRCRPDDRCFHGEWRCDGHPDCNDGEDERDCATVTPTEPASDGAWTAPPAGSAAALATLVPEGSVPLRSQGHLWILIIAMLLSILVAVGSVAVWVLSKAKSRTDTFSLENASREELIPDKSQTGSVP